MVSPLLCGAAGRLASASRQRANYGHKKTQQISIDRVKVGQMAEKFAEFIAGFDDRFYIVSEF